MSRIQDRGGLVFLSALLLVALFVGCAQIRLPAIDPTGNRIFLPPGNSTTLLTPNLVRNQQQVAPNAFGPSNSTFPSVSGLNLPAVAANNGPVIPAFTHPATPEPCLTSDQCALRTKSRKYIIPNPKGIKTAGKLGEIIMTPHKIIAPVGSEVVVLAGICGADGHYVLNQPLEWMLSNDSVGQFIEVGGDSHPTFNRLVPPTSSKIDGNFAHGRTGLKEVLLSRGTPTPVDDIQLLKGQTYISVSSESSGTSYITGLARNAEAWDKRRTSTIIHWVDGIWSIPIPTTATSGTVHPMTTVVSKSTSGDGLEGWKIRYTIVGGAPAEFAPTGSQTAETTTDGNGAGTVQIRQLAGKFEPGTTQVRVDVIRPELVGEPELMVESGITSVTWSAPALTIRAIGPKTAGVNEAFNYRIEVTNPGDQIARNVGVRTRDFADNLEFISSNPKPTQYGREFEWVLGDIAPSSTPKIIDIQLKSASKGNVGVCFEVASQSDGLQTEACAQTEISVPCLGLKVEGPERARVGEEVDFNIVIVNQCDETLRNIVVELLYDSGLSVRGMGNPVSFRIGELPFGERKVVPIQMLVNQPGTRCFDLSVSSDGGHTAAARECIEASQANDASVSLIVEGDRVTDVGTSAIVQATIKNNGNQFLNDLTLTNRFSDSIKPINRTDGFEQYWIADDEIAFMIRQLAPGQEVVISIEFEGVRFDGNARSEYTVTNRTGDVSQTKGLSIRVENAGSGFGRIPNRPTANGDPIRIPDDGQSSPIQQEQLRVDVRALTPNVAINDLARFEFTITNDRNSTDQNIDIAMLVPTSLSLDSFASDNSNLGLASQSPDGTRFDVKQILEMRPGEKIRFVASCIARQAGELSIEVRAQSAKSGGVVSDRDSVNAR